jgi:hypothetical protein
MKEKIRTGWGGLDSSDRKKISAFLKERFPDDTLSAQEVLDLARPKNSPIHQYFNWDDSDAAEKYRLYQARNLIKCIVVEIDDGVSVPKYCTPVMVDGYEKKRYVSLKRAISTPSIWEQILSRALEDAEFWNARYRHLRELRPISTAIDKTTKKLKKEKR